ncbi:unnamed protein product [Zymoseptoria tritici ST99CH_3D1]|nr:unnamed protein product [Zymoseptoria tritici ST99CH_3D1]
MAPTRRSTRVQQAPAVKQLQEKKKKEDAEAAKLKVTKKAPHPKTPLKGFTGIQSGRPFIIPRTIAKKSGLKTPATSSNPRRAGRVVNNQSAN